MKKLFVRLMPLFWLAVFSTVAEAQSQRITGSVTDERGAPVAHASVIAKGTNAGTVTDDRGNFVLTIPGSIHTLVISSINYLAMEVSISGSRLSVTLRSTAAGLEDVVVVGYGTQKKSNVTGAIASVKAADLEDMPAQRLEDALKGRTAGVTIVAASGQPGSGDPAVFIRGITSINGSSPLYVVEGMPVDGGIDYLNSGDIESIEVLKDAASAAIYGTKAAAGVIMVTTKSGKAGALKVNYNGYYGTQAPARELSLANAQQYGILRNESSLAAGNGLVFANTDALGKGTNWQDAIFNKSAKIENHELSFSGGSEKSVFDASLGLYQQDGIVATQVSNYKRFTVRVNSTHHIKPWLTFGENVAYAYIRSQAPFSENGYFGGPLASAINLDPITPVVETDPNVIANNPIYANNAALLVRNAAGNPYGISQYVGQEMSNPVAYVQTQVGNYGWSDKIVGNGFVEIEPVKGLKIKSNIGTDLAFWGSNAFTPLYFLSPTVNNTTTNNYTRQFNRANNWVFTNTATYSRHIDEHNFSVLIGYESENLSNQFGNSLTYLGIPAASFSEASMNYSVPTANTNGYGYENQPYTIASAFGRVTYDYDGRYLFTGIVRRDGSSHFGTNNLYATFPSASIGWNPTREHFWMPNRIVTALKIRAGYGVNGNDNLGPFQYESVISGAGSYVYNNNASSTIATGYAPQTIANPNLKWEQTSQADIGVDATLLTDLTMSVDWFKKKTTGMLMQVAIPGYVGATSEPWGNVASMYNEGEELQLGYHKRIGAFVIDWSGNVSHIENKVTDLGSTAYIVGQTFQSSAYEVSRTMVGHPFGSFYGFKVLGVFQNQAEINGYVDSKGTMLQPNAAPGDFKFAKFSAPGTGPIGANDRTFIGNPLPTWTFGTTLSLAYEGFDLKAFAQGVAGNKIFSELRRLDIPTANYSTKYLKRWTGPGSTNEFPRLVDGDPNGNFSNPSDFYLQDGAYLRLKTVQIGYTLTGKVLKTTAFDKIRVYVAGNNLLTITKYDGFDPELGGGLLGIDRGVYPQARSYMIGANITF
jgi:TonB-dependent starch-binding outer membrane protein SusC